MPIFEFTCRDCGAAIEKLFRNRASAESSDLGCYECGANLHLKEFSRVSFSSFKPFTTDAFDTYGEGQRTIEVSDRAQLRRLLRTHHMSQMGDSNSYFGSNPKSVPSWKEVCTQSKSGPDPKLVKKVKVVDPTKFKHLDTIAEATNFGRAATVVPESLRGFDA